MEIENIKLGFSQFSRMVVKHPKANWAIWGIIPVQMQLDYAAVNAAVNARIQNFESNFASGYINRYAGWMLFEHYDDALLWLIEQ